MCTCQTSPQRDFCTRLHRREVNRRLRQRPETKARARALKRASAPRPHTASIPVEEATRRLRSKSTTIGKYISRFRNSPPAKRGARPPVEEAWWNKKDRNRRGDGGSTPSRPNVDDTGRVDAAAASETEDSSLFNGLNAQTPASTPGSSMAGRSRILDGVLGSNGRPIDDGSAPNTPPRDTGVAMAWPPVSERGAAPSPLSVREDSFQSLLRVAQDGPAEPQGRRSVADLDKKARLLLKHASEVLAADEIPSELRKIPEQLDASAEISAPGPDLSAQAPLAADALSQEALINVSVPPVLGMDEDATVDDLLEQWRRRRRLRDAIRSVPEPMPKNTSVSGPSLATLLSGDPETVFPAWSADISPAVKASVLPERQPLTSADDGQGIGQGSPLRAKQRTVAASTRTQAVGPGQEQAADQMERDQAETVRPRERASQSAAETKAANGTGVTSPKPKHQSVDTQTPSSAPGAEAIPATSAHVEDESAGVNDGKDGGDTSPREAEYQKNQQDGGVTIGSDPSINEQKIHIQDAGSPAREAKSCDEDISQREKENQAAIDTEIKAVTKSDDIDGPAGPSGPENTRHIVNPPSLNPHTPTKHRDAAESEGWEVVRLGLFGSPRDFEAAFGMPVDSSSSSTPPPGPEAENDTSGVGNAQCAALNDDDDASTSAAPQEPIHLDLSGDSDENDADEGLLAGESILIRDGWVAADQHPVPNAANNSGIASASPGAGTRANGLRGAPGSGGSTLDEQGDSDGGEGEAIQLRMQPRATPERERASMGLDTEARSPTRRIQPASRDAPSLNDRPTVTKSENPDRVSAEPTTSPSLFRRILAQATGGVLEGRQGALALPEPGRGGITRSNALVIQRSPKKRVIDASDTRAGRRHGVTQSVETESISEDELLRDPVLRELMQRVRHIEKALFEL